MTPTSNQNRAPSEGFVAALSRRRQKRRVKAEVRRLLKLPRYEGGTSTILGRPIDYADAASFAAQYDEIWKRQIYQLPDPSSVGLILDCGANIGMGTLYFGTHYPKASIISFEPDPKIFAFLKQNCEAWGIDNATLSNAAVWTSEEGGLQFDAEGADSGSLVDTSSSERLGNTIHVPAKRLKDYLNKPIDLLKMDIEGAEVAVLEDCGSSLQCVKNLFVEYHSFVGQEQQLDRILSLLKRVGFRTHVDAGMVAPKPFVSRDTFNQMDQYLNIYGYRES